MNKPEASPSRARRWRRLAIELLIVLLIFLALKAWLQRDMISGEAPDFQARLLDGTPVSLADYQGAPVLVHFWATWCGICRLEQGSIESISRSWPVLTVAMQSGDADTLAAYMAEHGYTQAVIADEDGALAARFGVGAVPASFVLDAEGNVRFRERGFTTGWGLRARLWVARLL
ncbi:protein disulfide oxidoreductase [Ectothiorhodospira shaposhnikovii]|uniref:protein disulfide oxidoreductase n=1 Tax=Ectothiorhodospira shaposhnikovii TaxID=1054 RepID=UPI001EE99FC6|nr:protein disulfide oxidoreductase [Ectothiorhodospira shaposhnikovii]MCG5514455.1 protein disulfide oxidoreductase [Ectothiorhodospira shaposhnikovii]